MPGVQYVDLALDSSGDLDGSMRPVTGASAVIQRIACILKTVRGEWFWNDRAGIPWTNTLGRKVSRLPLLRVYITEAILGVRGVDSIRSCDLTLDAESRRVSVSLDVVISRETFGIRYLIDPSARGNTSPYIYSRVLPRT